MFSRPFPIRNFPAWALLGMALWPAGCIFDSKIPLLQDQGNQIYRNSDLDTLLPSGATADSVVTLFQPVLDPRLKPGDSAAAESFAPANIKDHAARKVVQYRVTRQRFGSWNAVREFQWNYFLLKANFLFAGGLPGAEELDAGTPSLYQRVHALDSFTNYFDSAAAPQIWAKINTSTKPGALGVAVKASGTGDSVLIRMVVANSPAGRSGMLPGMAILAVNDSSVAGDSALTRFLRFSVGDSGSKVKMEASGPGTAGRRTFNLVREPVAFPTVLVDSIQGVGYLSISGFTPNTVDSKSTYTELRDGLLATRRFPVTILDLRDNGGGSLDVAMRMCDEILPADSIIIRQVQRRFDESVRAPMESEITAVATAGGVGENAPDGSRRKYLLLGNENSASASEIFLVAVREGAGAPLMGVKTYGKGVGQTVRPTPAKGLALVTFLKFTSRSKLDYHLHGLEPDIEDLSDPDSLLANAARKALEMSGKAAAKTSAAAGAGRRLPLEAGLVEWNRREAVRPGTVELEALEALP